MNVPLLRGAGVGLGTQRHSYVFRNTIHAGEAAALGRLRAQPSPRYRLRRRQSKPARLTYLSVAGWQAWPRHWEERIALQNTHGQLTRSTVGNLPGLVAGKTAGIG